MAVHHLAELQHMISAGEDVVRRLRLQADEIERDVKALRRQHATERSERGASHRRVG